MPPELGIRVVVYGVAEASRQMGLVRGDLSRVAQTARSSQSSLSRLGAEITRLGDRFASAGRAITVGFTVPIIGTTGALVGAGIRFEEAFSGVSKTVDNVSTGFEELSTIYGYNIDNLTDLQKETILADKRFGELNENGERIREQFRALALDIPITADELARVGQVAGQLGVPQSQLAAFTETMARLGVSTDLSSDQAAEAIARFANIMGVESENLAAYSEGMANSLVALGNTTAATEPEILNLSLRLAAAGRKAGLTEHEILGLAASMAEMGVRSEMGGTAVSRILNEMIISISEGGDKLETFAQISGVTAEQFARDFQTDPAMALERFIENLGRMEAAGQLNTEQLRAMGLSGVRVRDVMGRLSPNIDLVNRNIQTANDGWNQQIALLEESEKRFKTVASIIQLTINTFADLGIELFDLVREDLVNLLGHVQDGITYFKNLDDETKRFILRVGLLVAALGPGFLIFGSLLQIVGNLIIPFGRFHDILSRILGLPLGILSRLFAPFLSLFTGLGSLAGGGLSFVSNFIGSIVAGIGKAGPQLLGAFRGALGWAFSQLGTIGGGLWTGLFQPLLGAGRTLFMDIFIGGLSTIVGPLGALLTPLRMLLSTGTSVLGAIPGLIGTISSAAGGAVSLLGDVFGTVFGLGQNALGTLADIGGGLTRFIFNNVLGFLGGLPKILLGGAGLLGLLFAPGVINTVARNWTGVFDWFTVKWDQFHVEMDEKTGETIKVLNFPEALKELGFRGVIEELFAWDTISGFLFSLGASKTLADELGKTFNRTYEIVKGILGDVKDLVGELGREIQTHLGTGAWDSLMQSNNELFLNIWNSVNRFLQGFRVGFRSTFGNIADGFGSVLDAVNDAMAAFGRLFDTIFGGVDEHVDGTIETVNTATDTASQFGLKAGEALGKIIEFTFRALALGIQLAAVFADAFADIVEAYQQGGIKGALEELADKASGVWTAISTAATMIWEEVKPKLIAFKDSVVAWWNEQQPTIKESVEGWFNDIGTWIRDTAWPRIVGALIGFFGPGGTLSTWIPIIYDWLKMRFNEAWEAIENSGIQERVENAFDGIQTGIEDWWNANHQAVADTVGEIARQIVSALGTALKEAMKEVLGLEDLSAKSLANWAVEGGINKIIEVPMGPVGKAARFGYGLGVDIGETTGITSLINPPEDIDIDLVSSVGPGMMLKTDAGMYMQGRQAGEHFDEGFRDVLELDSPSRVFLQHGVDIVQGLHDGVSQSVSILAAAWDLIRAALETGQSQMVLDIQNVGGAVEEMSRTVDDASHVIIQQLNRASSTTNDKSDIIRQGFHFVGGSANRMKTTVQQAGQAVIGQWRESASQHKIASDAIQMQYQQEQHQAAEGRRIIIDAIEAILSRKQKLAQQSEIYSQRVHAFFGSIGSSAQSARTQIGTAAFNIRSDVVGLVEGIRNRKEEFIAHVLSMSTESSGSLDRLRMKFTEVGNTFWSTTLLITSSAGLISSSLSSAAFGIAESFNFMEGSVVGNLLNVSAYLSQIPYIASNAMSGISSAVGNAASVIGGLNFGALQPQSPKTLLQVALENLDTYSSKNMRQIQSMLSYHPVPATAGGPTSIDRSFRPTIQGVPMQDERSAMVEAERAWRLAQMR